VSDSANGQTVFSVVHARTLGFVRWLERVGYHSYDPYDIWGTRYSLLARRLYYRRGVLGLPLVAPVLLMEILCPVLRTLFVRKERFATADSQLAMAFLNLHSLSQEPGDLAKARDLARDLIRSSVAGYSGLCWGYPFDWQNNTALWRRDTPYITTGPYCFEAFLRLFDRTGESEFREAAISAARFVYADLRDTPVGPDAAAASYSPIDNSKVINASAYRAFVLFEAAHSLGQQDYLGKAQRNLNFILQSQREDGSWLYALDSPGESFIDHFHTCFVIKNLWKINRHIHSAAVEQSIRRGYAYYRQALFDEQDQPRSFAILPRFQVVKLDLYNYAEAITLGVLLRDMIPEAFDLAGKLALELVTKYQMPAGHFVTRVHFGGWRHTFPYLRWPQAQLFFALTNFLKAAAEHRG
jgi:hypothetical protein